MARLGQEYLDKVEAWRVDRLAGGFHGNIMSLIWLGRRFGRTDAQIRQDLIKNVPARCAGREGEIDEAFANIKTDGAFQRKESVKHHHREKRFRVKVNPLPLPPPIEDGWREYLVALFRPGENIVMAPGRWDAEKQKDVPQDGKDRETHTLEDWIDRFDKCGGPSNYWDKKRFDGGIYVCINPMHAGRKAESASAYRNVLLEIDAGPLENQMGAFMESGVPVVAITTSGGKSLHGVGRVEAEDQIEYDEKVGRLYRAFAPYAKGMDNGNKDASRYSRLPGGIRHGVSQDLLHVDPAAEFADSWIEDTLDDMVMAELPEVHEGADYADNEPEEPDAIIEGLIETGDKMPIIGSSKARKSFFTIQLAIALAAGGITDAD